MTSSEVSIKDNCGNPRGESFSSGFSDHNDPRTVGEGQNGHSTVSAGRDAETALYTELWHACAGPLVTVPRERERVFYFPQGHIEQVEASTNQGADQQMPVYNLPSKILCRVINVSLKAEPDTDEVFAQVTLLPESNGKVCMAVTLPTGISTQLLQTLFKVKGVVHYGIAGNADPQLEIGDVTIPQFWAHSGLWNWQEVESNLSRFWNVLESKKLTQAVISKLEEALWINNRKYDALWCWEMLKLLAHFALRTRMRQGFQKVLQCFLKAFNEDRNQLKSNFCGLVLLLGSLPWRLNYQNLVFPRCRFQVVVAERIKLKEKKIKYTNELESKV